MSLSISEKAALQDESLSAVENLKGSAAFTQGTAYGLPEQHYSVSSLEEMNVDVAPHRAALELEIGRAHV